MIIYQISIFILHHTSAPDRFRIQSADLHFDFDENNFRFLTAANFGSIRIFFGVDLLLDRTNSRFKRTNLRLFSDWTGHVLKKILNRTDIGRFRTNFGIRNLSEIFSRVIRHKITSRNSI